MVIKLARKQVMIRFLRFPRTSLLGRQVVMASGGKTNALPALGVEFLIPHV